MLPIFLFFSYNTHTTQYKNLSSMQLESHIFFKRNSRIYVNKLLVTHHTYTHTHVHIHKKKSLIKILKKMYDDPICITNKFLMCAVYIHDRRTYYYKFISVVCACDIKIWTHFMGIYYTKKKNIYYKNNDFLIHILCYITHEKERTDF